MNGSSFVSYHCLSVSMVRRFLQDVLLGHKVVILSSILNKFLGRPWFLYDSLIIIKNIRSSSHQEIRKHYCLSSLRLTSSFINTSCCSSSSIDEKKICNDVSIYEHPFTKTEFVLKCRLPFVRKGKASF